MTKDADNGDRGGGRGCGPKWGWRRKGPWGGGPPWMRGGPFGPFSSGERPGRMFGQGDLRLLLLALIADQPSHGYDLIRTIEAKFAGSYAPSPGTIYPNLTMLEEQELIIAAAEAGGKKSYSVTDKGRQFLADNREQVQALMARIDIMAGVAKGRPLPESIMHAVQALRHAIMARGGGWSAAEEERIRAILEEAVRKIIGGERA